MFQLQRILNMLVIFVICMVLFAGYYYQFSKKEPPCPLCLLQRLGMIGSCLALVMNLRFGIKVEHYGLAILSAVLGRIASLKQMTLHLIAPRNFEPFLGLDLYVWAFIVFTCTIFACAILLILNGFSKRFPYKPRWELPEKILFCFVVLITFANTLTTLLECGFSGC